MEPAIPINVIFVGLPGSIQDKLTAHSVPAFELVGCARCSVEEIASRLAPDRTNIVVIDSTETWASGLARALRARQPDLRLLILADAARLQGYLLYDYDHLVENAGEDQVIAAVHAAAQDRPLNTR